MENMEISSELAIKLGGIFGAAFGFIWIITMIISMFTIVCTWKCYVKMGEPGWVSIVPYYNLWVLFKHTWDSGWMMFTTLIPLAGPIIAMITYYKLFERFGKSTVFSVLGMFFTPIMMAICAFDDSIYNEF